MPKEKVVVGSLPVDVVEDTIYVIDQLNPNSFTHNYFKYPCKFIPEIPRWAIRSFINPNDEARILDPFAGSGTTLLEASLAGISSMGTEIDDVAKLIIKVKTTKLNNNQINQVLEVTNELVNRLERKKYNNTEVILPEINNLNHWFSKESLYDLGHIYYSICQIDDNDVSDFLRICMASIVKRVSNADDISPKPYVSNKIIKNPPPVAKTYSDIVCRYIDGMKELSGIDLAPVVVAGNATNIEATDNEFDLAITSPPYINAFDYVRTLRLENLWLNTSTESELREKKKEYFGTESIKKKDELKSLEILEDSSLLKKYYSSILEVDEKRALVVKRFFEDMKKNLKEVYRTLKPGARYIIVIGNSSIRKIDVESWKVLRDIALVVGFNYQTHIGYEIQNPYIRIPRGNQGGKIAFDHMLVISK